MKLSYKNLASVEFSWCPAKDPLRDALASDFRVRNATQNPRPRFDARFLNRARTPIQAALLKFFRQRAGTSTPPPRQASNRGTARVPFLLITNLQAAAYRNSRLRPMTVVQCPHQRLVATDPVARLARVEVGRRRAMAALGDIGYGELIDKWSGPVVPPTG